jgi:hypothetical protein
MRSRARRGLRFLRVVADRKLRRVRRDAMIIVQMICETGVEDFGFCF